MHQGRPCDSVGNPQRFAGVVVQDGGIRGLVSGRIEKIRLEQLVAAGLISLHKARSLTGLGELEHRAMSLPLEVRHG